MPDDNDFQSQLKPLVAGLTGQDLYPTTMNFVIWSWALLIFAPRWKWTPALTLIVPLYHSLMHAVTLVSLNMADDAEQPDVSTLQGVAEMFQDPNVAFLGWIHFLAFDHLVGRMIVFDSIERGASMTLHILVIVPCLFGTFLLGPTVWILYMGLRHLFLPSIANEQLREFSGLPPTLKPKTE